MSVERVAKPRITPFEREPRGQRLKIKGRNVIIKGRVARVNCAMLPIQATPELSGEDAQRLVVDVMRKPNERTMEKNKQLISMVRDMRSKEHRK